MSVERWRRWLERSKASGEPVFAAWHVLIDLSDDEFAARARELLAGGPLGFWDLVALGRKVRQDAFS